MSKFKVGDRVRVFEGKRTYEGRIESVGSGSTGQVIDEFRAYESSSIETGTRTGSMRSSAASS
jgi:hypothetical protein